MSTRLLASLLVVLSLGVWAGVIGLPDPRAQSREGLPAIDADDIAGVVTGPTGPEAGVWVIAETTDLPTRFVRIVVTDDRGPLSSLPDLPKATYHVWVRGYGLVDSPKIASDARHDART